MALSAIRKVGGPLGGTYWREKSTIRKIVTVLVLLVLLALAYLVVRDLLIFGLYSHYVDQLAQRTGLNQHLINILAWLFLAPFVLGCKDLLSPFGKRTRGIMLLTLVAVAYNAAFYIANATDRGPSVLYAGPKRLSGRRVGRA